MPLYEVEVVVKLRVDADNAKVAKSAASKWRGEWGRSTYGVNGEYAHIESPCEYRPGGEDAPFSRFNKSRKLSDA